MAEQGTFGLRIERVDDSQTRITFRLGAPWSRDPHGMAPEEGESVLISVLARLPANPPLLDVQVAALKKARSLIAAQIQALEAAIDQADEAN